ncbi:MAG: hypothetical protein JWO70_2981 [Betaproteobacteria bacterium]|nr:hypothetical protein [Betaproteobacteria bacterium]
MNRAIACTLAVLTAAASFSAAAENFPAKPIRLVVPFAPGGPNDFVARLFSEKLPSALGQSIIVDNRGGAGGNIAHAIVARAAPDGYTLGVFSSTFVVNPSLFGKNAGYDPVREFTPVLHVASSPAIIVTHPSLPAKTVRQLIAASQTTPLSYASGGIGTVGHLGGEMLKTMAHIRMEHIAYKGSGPALIDVMANNLPVGFTAVSTAVPHIRTGRLNPIAVTSLKRIAALPSVATVAESGFPGYEVANFIGIAAPAGTSPGTVRVLHARMSAVIVQDDFRERMAVQGFETTGGTPDEFRQYIVRETAKWGPLVLAAGMKPE